MGETQSNDTLHMKSEQKRKYFRDNFGFTHAHICLTQNNTHFDGERVVKFI